MKHFLSLERVAQSLIDEAASTAASLLGADQHDIYKDFNRL